MTEHEAQVFVINWANSLVWACPELALLFAIKNEVKIPGRAGMQVVRAFKAEGLKKGVPDLCLPVARGGYHGCFIELKKPGGVISPEQAKWLDALTAQGYYATLCIGPDDAIQTLADYLGIKST